MSPARMSPRELMRSKDRFFILVCLIMGLLVVVPILKRYVAAHIFLEIFLTAIVIFMVYTVSHKRLHVIAGVFLATVMLVAMWSQYFYPHRGIMALSMIVGALFIGLAITGIIGFLLKTGEVNREIIFAALLLYLLAGLMWAFVYTFLELVDPASFNIDLGHSKSPLFVFQYYSFVTITTLGYGDITPVTEVAKALSVLEAVVGQLYLVVAVAWLVGMHVSRKSK